MPSLRRTQAAYGHSVWPRSRAILAVTVAMSLLSTDTGFAAWPWSREPAKVPPKRITVPKRVTAPKRAAAPKRVTAPKPASLKCELSKLRVILDVGHTAQSQGALSARNIPEFDFNVQIARRIGDKLKSEGFVETSLLVTERSEEHT